MWERWAEIHPIIPGLVSVIGLLLVSAFAYWLCNRLLVSTAHTLAMRSAQTWDDALVKSRVFARLCQLVPATIIYQGVNFIPGLSQLIKTQALTLSGAYMILAGTFTITAILSAANDIYESRPRYKQLPIKGFVQLAQLVVLIVGGVLVIAALLNRSPVILLGGFGAMTAVLLLVFKDTILSLVASVQLSAQDMVRVGDWIEVPQFGADGDVIDVGLYIIKVQNWDKTIITIPTHRMIDDSFKNWRGMANSGGRRIKRALHLDTTSIRFLTGAEIDRYKRFALLETYIETKQQALDDFNAALGSVCPDDVSNNVNLRRLTNVGTFRAYVFNYLKHHPQVRKDMTLLVRQLTPGPEGLPLELYCFTATTAWEGYEDVQGDIFDHLLTIVPEFGLRLYQQPTGADLAGWSQR